MRLLVRSALVRHIRALVPLLLLPSLFLAADGQQQKLEQVLKQRYEKRVVKLRPEPLDEEDVTAWLDAKWNEKEWVPHGYLAVHHVELDDERVDVEGYRRFVYLDPENKLQIGTGVNYVRVRVAFPKKDFAEAAERIDRFLEPVGDAAFHVAAQGCRELKILLRKFDQRRAASEQRTASRDDVSRKNKSSDQAELRPPQCILCPSPLFKHHSMPRGLQKGRVIFNALIDKWGHISCLKPSESTHPSLVAPAAEAISTWKYKRAERAGKMIPIITEIEITYERYSVF